MMTRIRRTLRALREDERGLSMAELLIGMILTTLILAMVMSMFIQTAKITKASNETKQNNAVAANAMNELSAVLRVTSTNPKSGSAIPDSAIQAATRSSITVYSLSDRSDVDPHKPAPVKVTFANTYDNTRKVWELIETRCTGVASGGYWTFTSCSKTEIRKFQGIQPSTSVDDQLFTYYNANNQPIVIGTGPMGQTDREDVASILIRVTGIDQSSKSANTKAIVLQNLVYLRNLGLDSGS